MDNKLAAFQALLNGLQTASGPEYDDPEGDPGVYQPEFGKPDGSPGAYRPSNGGGKNPTKRPSNNSPQLASAMSQARAIRSS